MSAPDPAPVPRGVRLAAAPSTAAPALVLVTVSGTLLDAQAGAAALATALPDASGPGRGTSAPIHRFRTHRNPQGAEA